jgi:hypothetical protein
MPRYSVNVVRGGGEIAPVPIVDDAVSAVFGLALERAQHLVVHGCPFGDRIAPRCVEIRDECDGLLISIAIDESLRPADRSL